MQVMEKLTQQLFLLRHFFLPARSKIFFQSRFLIIIEAMESGHPIMLFRVFYIKHFTVYPDLFSWLDPLNFMIGQGNAMQCLLFHPLFHPVTNSLLLHTKENKKQQGSEPKQDKP